MLVILAGAISLLSPYSADAQSKWSIDLRPGVNFATKKLGNTDLNTGVGIEGTVAYRFMPHLGAYAGWSWNRFGTSETSEANDMDIEETGYSFGLQFIHPISAQSRINYIIKGGGTYNHIETENSQGNIVNDTGHGLGWQLGVGAAIPVGKRVSLIPEVRYRSLSRDIKIGNTSTAVDLNYVSAGVGVSFSF